MHSINTTFPFGLGLKGIILLLTDHPLHPHIFFFFWSTQLAVSQFPNQGLNPSHSRESLESYPLDDQGTPHDYLFIKRSLVGYKEFGTSLVVQLLRLHTSSVGGVGSIPGQEMKIPHGEQAKKKKEREPGSLPRRKSHERSQTTNLLRTIEEAWVKC